ncbi:carboxypeptidase-like regulatory domain-containing protein [Catalinimonas alkaloidigena]|uniref:carboxypeptidase-like regulatory domain-containing protein n=1 Tax=Catalinimonas alkaloidigena TaxID=1075417 RepID=UPI002405CEB6|nr:carboxypeptidase-like regulatory domain-containing protein [Catalinimonas alkaloidigena]
MCFQPTFLLIIASGLCYGQAASVSGSVYSENGEAIPGVYVQLNGKQATVTDEKGLFSFKNLKSDEYAIVASCVGFQAMQKTIQLKQGEALMVKFILKDDITQLNEVTVRGKSEARELRESTTSVTVLETRKLYAQSNTTSDVIKQISGVNVRQTGGFGSDAEVYINGMSGKQQILFSVKAIGEA